MNLGGNIVSTVLPGLQAQTAGVYAGWRIISIDKKAQPNDTDHIIQVIQEKKASGMPFDITFFKGRLDIKLEIGDTVVLSNLKKQSDRNGMKAKVIKVRGKKYDV